MAHSFPARRTARLDPVHGLLSAYPLAFFTGALVTDIIYANSTNMMWANFSAWLITGGMVMGVLAAIVGIVDGFVNRGRRRLPVARAHDVLVIFMLAFGLVNAFVHSRDAWTSVVPTGLILSIITAILAIVASWIGFSLLSREEVR